MKKLLINLNTKICTLLFIFNFLLSQSKDYPITPIPFSQVKIVDKFFAKKIETNHYVTIPIAVQKSQESGRIDNFKRAAGIQEGEFCSIYPFDDSDIYKIIEAASYSIQTFPDKKMELMIDSLIFFTAAAQEKEKDLSKSQAVERAKQVEKGRVLRVDQTSRNYRVKMLKKSGRVVSVDVDKRSGRVKDSQKGSSEH